MYGVSSGGYHGAETNSTHLVRLVPVQEAKILFRFLQCHQTQHQARQHGNSELPEVKLLLNLEEEGRPVGKVHEDDAEAKDRQSHQVLWGREEVRIYRVAACRTTVLVYEGAR
jgi:hypothetical protein